MKTDIFHAPKSQTNPDLSSIVRAEWDRLKDEYLLWLEDPKDPRGISEQWFL